jgi:F0F1-type ATP synthase assembly protein I
MLSAWSFTLVISSFLFMFAGRWLDREIGTEPFFMLGLFILGTGLCIGRIYTDFIRVKDELDKKKITYTPQHIVK